MLYKILRVLLRGFNRLVCRYRVIGLERVPSSGPLLIVTNHLSFYDPLLLGIVRELTHEPMSFVVWSASDEADDNRKLLRESRQLMAEYVNDCRTQGLQRSASNGMGEKQRLRASETENEMTVQ